MSINQVPKKWRTLYGTALSIEQIENIVNNAEESDKPFSVALCLGFEEFKNTHKVSGKFWLPIEKGE